MFLTWWLWCWRISISAFVSSKESRLSDEKFAYAHSSQNPKNLVTSNISDGKNALYLLFCFLYEGDILRSSKKIPLQVGWPPKQYALARPQSKHTFSRSYGWFLYCASLRLLTLSCLIQNMFRTKSHESHCTAHKFHVWFAAHLVVITFSWIWPFWTGCQYKLELGITI